MPPRNLLAFLLLFLGLATPARSDSLICGVMHAYGAYPLGPYSYAQQFTLHEWTALSSVSFLVYVGYPQPPSESFTVQLTNQIGPNTTSANVLTSATTVAPQWATPATVSMPIVLSPGSYYFVLSSGSTYLALSVGYAPAPSIINTAAGSVGSAFYSWTNSDFPPDASWYPAGQLTGHIPPVLIEFQLFGSQVPQPIPEPSSIVLVGTGLFVWAWKVARVGNPRH